MALSNTKALRIINNLNISIPIDMDGIVFHGDNAKVVPGINSNCIDLVASDIPYDTQKARWFLEGVGYVDAAKWHPTKHPQFLAELEKKHNAAYRVIRGAMYNDTLKVLNRAAYLCSLTAWLLHCHRMLKKTGNIAIQCDYRIHHPLKMLMDAIFGEKNFRADIKWLRNDGGVNSATRNLQRRMDHILWYGMDPKKYTFNQDAITIPYDMNNLDEETLERFDKIDENGRRYCHGDLAAPRSNKNPNQLYELMGITRRWRWLKPRMLEAVADGRVIQTASGNVPVQIRYLDEQKGRVLGDFWDDIMPVGGTDEDTGWPDQKPVLLYERIVLMLSNPGDIVADFYCGCGTTLIAAQKHGRVFVGAEQADDAITMLACRLKGYTKEARDKAVLLDPDWEQRMLSNRKFVIETTPPERTDDIDLINIPNVGRVTRHKEQLAIKGKEVIRKLIEILERLGFERGQCVGCLDVAKEGPGLPLIEDQRHADHKSPVADGGLDNLENRCSLCPACNLLKREGMTLSKLRATRFGSTKKAEEMHPVKKADLNAMAIIGREEEAKAFAESRLL